MNLRPSWQPRAKRWPDLRRMKRDLYVEPHEHAGKYRRDSQREGYIATCDCGARGFISDKATRNTGEPWSPSVVWD